ncbi:MAG TPA: glycerophosphodiester phosphodiesterase [Capillimicrobium sp.]|nr:glycerophosphodiester phosphodiesterase [Capillimicrobium sp.]
MLRSPSLAIAAAVAAALPAVASAATPQIQAHRGGTYVDGRPTFPEAGMPAFEAAAKLGVTLELDIQMTKDGVPVVLHDDTLDRTTTCTGPVAERTLKRLRRACRIDVLGVPDNDAGLPWRTTKRTYEIPTLAEVLVLAKAERRSVSVELKQYDPTGASARAFAKAVRASKLPLRRVVAQSFFPPNLEAVAKALPGVTTSVLTIAAGNASGMEIAGGVGARWVSPQWPVDAAYVGAAHAAGLRVVPFTLDSDEAIRAAKAAGVDAVITDDPTMARWALR